MKAFKEKNRNELLAIISRQRQEIDALRERVEALEAEDVGQLQSRVEELEAWKVEAKEQIRQSEVKTAMTQGLVELVGISLFALLGEKLVEVLNCFDDLEDKILELAEEKKAELEEQLGEVMTKIIQTVQQIDHMSLQAWHRQQAILERRASTLPPLKRAIYEALSRLASPSKAGTQILNALLTSDEFAQKLTGEEKRKMGLLASLFDTFSNIWPLTVTNSLAPMLKYVGFDDAAEAAGEILDQLEDSGVVPRHLVHKVRPDLIQMRVIEAGTKPDTIVEFLAQGYQLQKLGLSPDRAYELGLIPSSPTQLKRSKRVFEGLQELYNRVSNYPGEVPLERLETFGESIKRLAEEKVAEYRELIVAELN